MNRLYIYPTSRSIRAAKTKFLNSNQLLPKMATIADFESRSILAGEFALVNKLERKLFLKEATNFRELDPILKDSSLVKFYTHADDFFNFFQEITAEGVSIKDLYLADTYAEFERDLELLERVLKNYQKILEQHKLTDRIFLPNIYRINRSFIESFDSFYIELEGYLTKFELNLFLEIAKIRPFLINLRVTPFNKKIVDAFKELGVALEDNSEVTFNLSTKEIIKSKKVLLNIDCEVIQTNERIEQIAIAMAKIEQMVQSGIDPNSIALIVPDESIVPIIKAFDHKKNFNFAMGQSFKELLAYKFLDQIYRYLSGDKIAKEFLVQNCFDFKKLPSSKKITVEAFFETLKLLDLPLFSSDNLLKELDRFNLLEGYYNFIQIMQTKEFSFKEWLFLWLYELKEHTIDDTSGGKVTVMGLLESRGVVFDGVVIIDFNDDKVPSISSKDRFLNSTVRAYANLPTRADRENLQKHYYARVLERAKQSCIIYTKSDNLQPSKFLFELGLHKSIKQYKIPHNLLFATKKDYNAYSHMENIEFEYDALKTTWSASKLKTFLECKRKFYYRYVLQIQEPKSQEINDGLMLHYVLSKVINKEQFYLNKKELRAAIAKELAKISDDNSMLIYKKPLWINMLKGFIKREVQHFNDGWRVKDIEFSLKGEIGGLLFSGRIDRIDFKENQQLVIDYKSGSISGANSKNVQKLEDFQMSIYKLLLNSPSDTNYAFIEILNDGKMSYLSAAEEKEAMLLEHIEYLKSHKNFKAERCEDLYKCRFCPYQLLCHRGEYL